jgi:hypothetical protein
METTRKHRFGDEEAEEFLITAKNAVDRRDGRLRFQGNLGRLMRSESQSTEWKRFHFDGEESASLHSVFGGFFGQKTFLWEAAAQIGEI